MHGPILRLVTDLRCFALEEYGLAGFWDSKEDAEAYGQISYPEVLKVLTDVIEGTPTVKTFDFARLTVQQATAARLA